MTRQTVLGSWLGSCAVARVCSTLFPITLCRACLIKRLLQMRFAVFGRFWSKAVSMFNFGSARAIGFKLRAASLGAFGSRRGAISEACPFRSDNEHADRVGWIARR